MNELLKKIVDFDVKKSYEKKSVYNRWEFSSYLKSVTGIEEYFFMPFEVSWQITGRCNLNCNYCYAKTLRKKGELSTEKCHEIIDEFAKYKIYDITLEGGEVFLREDILEIIEHIKQKKLWLDILTNGFLLDEKKVVKLKNLLDSRVDGLQISIDSVSNNGISEKLRRNIKLMIENGLNIRVNIVLTKENTANLKKLYMQCMELGIKNGFSIAEIIPIGGGRMVEKPTLDERLKAYIDIKEIESHKLPIMGSPAILKSNIQYRQLFNKKSKSVSNNKRHHCSGGRIKANISCNGNVYPCAFLQYDKFMFGNIANERLEAIWNSKKAQEYRRVLKELDNCKGCPNKNECSGGCFGASYAYTKDLTTPDPRCISNI